MFGKFEQALIAASNAILDDAIALIRGQSDTVSTSDALAVIEDFREQLAKHDVS